MLEEYKCKSCSKEDSGERINVGRFIDKLNFYFKKNDYDGALRLIEYWENEASILNDDMGLLSVLNEKIGLSRKINNETICNDAVSKALPLLNENDRARTSSGATILTNIATALSAFNKTKDAINYYIQAARIYENKNLLNSYEYAAMLNNMAMALSDDKRYDDAVMNIEKAIDILKENKEHDAEIAVSYVNLSHILYDKYGDKANDDINKNLDLAWEYINSNNQSRDANYAYVLSKCAPSFLYFKRDMEAEALKEVSDEIYGMY